MKLAAIFLLISISLSGQDIPLRHAHSHNDYERKRPFKDALKHGFTSIEADVLYIKRKLFVGHDLPTRRYHKLKSFTRQYLRPLYRVWKKNDGEIYPGYTGDFYLWIDIKSEPSLTYKNLRETLFHFKDMLNYYENGTFHKGKVTVVLSGSLPIDLLLNDKLQLMTLDGRPSDLSKNYPGELMPFISERADKISGTTDPSKVNQAVLDKIKRYIDACHAQDKKTRLWATPENEKIWGLLLHLGIDLINTDDLSRLQNYLMIYDKQK